MALDLKLRSELARPLTWDEGDDNFRRIKAAVEAFEAETGDGGAGIITYRQPGTGAVWRRLMNKALETVTPEEYGAVGNGIADDTAAIQAALNALSLMGGGELVLLPRRVYLVSSMITVPDWCSVIGPRTARILAKAGTGGFNNSTIAGQHGSNAGVFSLSGETSGAFTPSIKRRLSGFTLESEVLDGRRVAAVVARNCKSPVIEGIEVFGFCTGAIINCDSWQGGHIEYIELRDCTTSHAWATTGETQLTGIRFDDFRVNSQGSFGAGIRFNVIERLTLGSALVTAFLYQSDAIHLAHQLGSRFDVSNNRIAQVGEGIDIFASNCTVNSNTVTDAYIAAYKLVHGASFNTLNANVARRFGKAALNIGGSTDPAATDTARNAINGLIAEVCNFDNSFPSDNACIYIEDNGGSTGKPKDNTVNGGSLAMGGLGKYGWLDLSTGTNNYGSDPHITGVGGAPNVARVHIPGGAGVGGVRLIGTSSYATAIA